MHTVDPTPTTPTPPICALDLRALSLFRAIFVVYYLLELAIERIPNILSLDGSRNENIAPAHWVNPSNLTTASVYLTFANPMAHAAFLALTVVCCGFLWVGYGTTPVALVLMYLDSSYLNRNPIAMDEHSLLVNRMCLAIAFTPCDRVPINWSQCWFRTKPKPTDINPSTPPTRRVRPRTYYRYDNSWASALIYVSVIMLWLQIGLEKFLDPSGSWWLKADAVQMIMIGNHCLSPAVFISWLQAAVLPRIVSQWLCRTIVLIECPFGPLLMIWPDDRVRTVGLVATSTCLLMFGTMLKVDWFPFSVLVCQTALCPASLMDRCGHWFVAAPHVEHTMDEVMGRDGREEKDATTRRKEAAIDGGEATIDGGKATIDGKEAAEHLSTIKNAAPCMAHTKGITWTTLPNMTYGSPPPLPSSSTHPPAQYGLHLLLRYTVHGFLCCCVCSVIFCGVRNTHTNRGGSMGAMTFMSNTVDQSMQEFAQTLSLSTGWSAGSPPPTAITWAVMVGYPAENTAWNNVEGWGVHVQFQHDEHSKAMEGTPMRHSFWTPPPNITCAGHRQFLVSKEKFYGTIFGSEDPVYAIPRANIFQHACRGFHVRHPLEEEKLTSIKLYMMSQTIEDPWSYPPVLGTVTPRLVGHMLCE